MEEEQVTTTMLLCDEDANTLGPGAKNADTQDVLNMIGQIIVNAFTHDDCVDLLRAAYGIAMVRESINAGHVQEYVEDTTTQGPPKGNIVN